VVSSIEKAIQHKAAIAARAALPAANEPEPDHRQPASVGVDSALAHSERAGVSGASVPPRNPSEKASEKPVVQTPIEALWARFEQANNALAPDHRLKYESEKAFNVVADLPPFHFWLKAKSGAALTCTGDGIRYIWRKQDYHKGNSFWIRWKADKGYVVNHRVRSAWFSSYTEERLFKESAVEYILECLVKGVRINPKSICVRKFWFF
jgi:hypothetical protein